MTRIRWFYPTPSTANCKEMFSGSRCMRFCLSPTDTSIICGPGIMTDFRKCCKSEVIVRDFSLSFKFTHVRIPLAELMKGLARASWMLYIGFRLIFSSKERSSQSTKERLSDIQGIIQSITSRNKVFTYRSPVHADYSSFSLRKRICLPSKTVDSTSKRCVKNLFSNQERRSDSSALTCCGKAYPMRYSLIQANVGRCRLLEERWVSRESLALALLTRNSNIWALDHRFHWDN